MKDSISTFVPISTNKAKQPSNITATPTSGSPHLSIIAAETVETRELAAIDSEKV